MMPHDFTRALEILDVCDPHEAAQLRELLRAREIEAGNASLRQAKAGRKADYAPVKAANERVQVAKAAQRDAEAMWRAASPGVLLDRRALLTEAESELDQASQEAKLALAEYRARARAGKP